MSPDFDLERWKPASLLPPRSRIDTPLLVVVAILVFIACVAAMSALAAGRAAGGWTRQLEHSATVVVRADGRDSPDVAAARVTEALAGVPGVLEARAMGRPETDALLKPWLGAEALLADLPTPRLVAVELDPENPPPGDALKAAIALPGVFAVLDNHSRWMAEIKAAAGRIRLILGALAVLAGIGIVAVIALAVRASLLSSVDVIEVLSLFGARPEFIADLVQQRQAISGLQAAVIGSTIALLAGAGLKLAQSGTELLTLVPIDWIDLLVCPALAVAAALLSLLFARLACLAHLRGIARPAGQARLAQPSPFRRE